MRQQEYSLLQKRWSSLFLMSSVDASPTFQLTATPHYGERAIAEADRSIE